MQGQSIQVVRQAIQYIERHQTDKIELEKVAASVNYSKYHLHRMFVKTVGLTLHEYVVRRRLTEAARFLVSSGKPILEIALDSGYGSQRAFASVFKTMYKTTPAEFRDKEEFYPLQMEIFLREEPVEREFTKDDIVYATYGDVGDWMELVNLTIDGYPCLREGEYRNRLNHYVENQRALLLREQGLLVGAMGISYENCTIDYLAVHPQYRRRRVESVFLDKLACGVFCGREIRISTFRAGDKADTGHREMLCGLGFVERELTVEFGYPTQQFVFPPADKEETRDGRKKG